MPYNSSFDLTVDGNKLTTYLYGATRTATLDSTGHYIVKFTDEFGATVTFDITIDSNGNVSGTYTISGLAGSCEIKGSKA
jgi:hypothetical protein